MLHENSRNLALTFSSGTYCRFSTCGGSRSQHCKWKSYDGEGRVRMKYKTLSSVDRARARDATGLGEKRAFGTTPNFADLLRAVSTDMSKSRRIGCVIPRCNLQCGITQPIL